MSKPFDAARKAMLECGPADWLALAGHPGRTARVIDADVSAVSAATDKVVEVSDRPPWLFDVNFQTGPDASLPRRVHLYNTLLHERHEMPVRSLVVLLTRDANLSVINGYLTRGFAGEPPYLEFRYQVIRVWELPPEPLLAGGLATLALAPLGRVTAAELPAVVRRMGERLTESAYSLRAPEVWTASSILMGLKYEEALIERLVSEVRGMAEFVTIKIFERWGAIKRAKETLIQMGTVKFGGEPSDAQREQILAIGELPRFDELNIRLLGVNSWDELLAPPPAPSKTRSRKKR